MTLVEQRRAENLARQERKREKTGRNQQLAMGSFTPKEVKIFKDTMLLISNYIGEPVSRKEFFLMLLNDAKKKYENLEPLDCDIDEDYIDDEEEINTEDVSGSFEEW